MVILPVCYSLGSHSKNIYCTFTLDYEWTKTTDDFIWIYDIPWNAGIITHPIYYRYMTFPGMRVLSPTQCILDIWHSLEWGYYHPLNEFWMYSIPWNEGIITHRTPRLSVECKTDASHDRHIRICRMIDVDGSIYLRSFFAFAWKLWTNQIYALGHAQLIFRFTNISDRNVNKTLQNRCISSKVKVQCSLKSIWILGTVFQNIDKGWRKIKISNLFPHFKYFLWWLMH